APLLGRWSDRIGRRPVLLVSIAGNAAGFALLGIAGSVPLLFASRLLAGLTGGNMAAALATANLGLAAALLPETLTPARRVRLARRPRAAVTPAALFAALARPTVGPLLLSRAVFMVAFVSFQMIFPLWALDRL